MFRLLLVALSLSVALATSAQAGIKSKAATEAAEYLTKKFGKEAAEQGVETLSRKIEVLAVRHGDEAIIAVKRVGPRALQLVDEAGEHAPQAIKLLARHGDDAVWVVSKSNRLALFTKYGDEAAEAMIKHGQIAEPLVQSLGQPAATALQAVSTQGGRRLAILADDGALAAMGKTDQILNVIARHGDRAMDFVWRNKGALTVAATLTAFLANPEPFLDGTTDLARTVAENIGKPIAQVPGQVAQEAARHINWTAVLAVAAIVLGCLAALRSYRRQRRAVTA